MDIYPKTALYTLLGLNVEALKKALDYIGDSEIRMVLFTTEYSALKEGAGPLEKTTEVIEKMNTYIDIFEK